MTPKNGLTEDIEALRRFGLAVTRDDWLICEAVAAEALVERLSRQAALAANNSEGATPTEKRVRLFQLFIRLYRRHVRLAMFEDAAAEAQPHFPLRADAGERASPIELAVRALPLELREALLLVTLERFSHRQAAEALDIKFAMLIDRLARARRMLAQFCEPVAAPANLIADRPSRRGAPHLRLVK